MSALDDRLRSAADAIHRQTEGLSIPADLDDTERPGDDRRRSGRLLVVLAAAVVVALVASVAVGLTRGGSDGSGGGTLSIEALATATQKESAHLTLAVTFSTSLFGEDQSKAPKEVGLTFDGLVDFRRKTGRIDVLQRSPTGGALKRTGTQLLVDGHVYNSISADSVPEVPAEIRRTKRWIEIDPSKSSGSLTDLSPFDPLAQFRGHDIKLDDRGMTRLRGEDVHHYRGTQRTEYTPPSSSGPKQKLVEDFDLYVDRQNRLIRLSGVTHYADRTGTTKTQVDFSDFGVRVHVNAPPADQVVRESDLPSAATSSTIVEPSTTTTTQPTFTRRQSLLLIRDDLGASRDACKSPGAQPDRKHDGLCQIWGRTLLSGDDVTSAVARFSPSLNNWCVTPTLTPAGSERLRAYMANADHMYRIPVKSHGRNLEDLLMDPEFVRSGSCWITSNGMTESAARALASELSL